MQGLWCTPPSPERGGGSFDSKGVVCDHPVGGQVETEMDGCHSLVCPTLESGERSEDYGSRSGPNKAATRQTGRLTPSDFVECLESLLNECTQSNNIPIRCSICTFLRIPLDTSSPPRRNWRYPRGGRSLGVHKSIVL